MYIIPKPKEMDLREGSFYLFPHTPLLLHNTCKSRDFNATLFFQEFLEQELGFKCTLSKVIHFPTSNYIALVPSPMSEEAYSLDITPLSITIKAGSSTGFFYGFQTLKQIIKQYSTNLPCVYIEDEPYFKHRGFYHDITRGKVPTLETLKTLIDRCSHYKINEFQLYIEHTFAFSNMSEMWFDKDPLTAEDILYLDAYCKERHIELIPSLSTFGHLYELLRTQSFKHLCELKNSDADAFSFTGRMRHHMFNPTDPNSVSLICKMLDEFIPLFSSKHFNICGDETFDLGKGKSKSTADVIGPGKLYTNFLNQIIDHVKSYDKKVMFWSDIILHHSELLSDIPKDVICLTWNYTKQGCDSAIQTISKTDLKQYVCPSVLGWNRLFNHFEDSYMNIQNMIQSGQKHHAIGVLNTDWGDYGHINLLGPSIPGMIFGGALSWSPDSIDFDTLCKGISKIEYGDDTEELMSLLTQISKTQLINWTHLVKWKELNEPIHVNPDELSLAYERLTNLEVKLLEHKQYILRNSLDFNEFLICTRGIKLFLSLGLSLHPSEELARLLEAWFYDYSHIWLLRNRPSELHRLKEVIHFICLELRNN